MRLIVILLTTAILQVSAGSYAQKITLSEKNSALVKIFDKISDQTGYDFLVTNETLRHAKLVSIHVKDTELKTVLEKIFEGQSLTFNIQEKMVVVSKKTSSFLDKTKEVILKLFQDIDVRGVVTDSQGMPLPGATVKVKDSGKRTVANGKGEFFLQEVDEKAVLVISYLGYENRELNAGKDLGVIKLSLAEGKLEEVEVVSTGYQNILRERATGSFELLNNETLNRKIGSNIISRLDGNSSILFDNRTKAPNLQIRGLYTFTETISQPLIILDNFPYEGDINNINPNDFWASWCKPCRAETPNMKKVYEAFHDQGFNIIGVSTDAKEADWKKALADENTTWFHGRDNLDKASKAIFSISAIPAFALVDAEGKLIAFSCGMSNIPSFGPEIRGEGLYKTVEELLNNQEK